MKERANPEMKAESRRLSGRDQGLTFHSSTTFSSSYTSTGQEDDEDGKDLQRDGYTQGLDLETLSFFLDNGHVSKAVSVDLEGGKTAGRMEWKEVSTYS